MPKFRKKPVEIEAVLYCGQFNTEIRPWLISANVQCKSDHAIIRTLEGDMRCEVGDWIIRGVKGELYPCKPDIFAATYDPV
ncbi:hypothetical protein ASG52_19880 [Methylobacterium sp. Leaf456]|uniref:hypothetical protein n=1 Tax=Methylobacterium sp. Leaf456 TaxID=1736382 RepID=UPI0006F314ED|nr:hypothetical protein [Methylobacterium sp. Leaf456]KQT59988.1 hypothetical protein ASG52_19880 [Methylobacterium sp. Leaf456]